MRAEGGTAPHLINSILSFRQRGLRPGLGVGVACACWGRGGSRCGATSALVRPPQTIMLLVELSSRSLGASLLQHNHIWGAVLWGAVLVLCCIMAMLPHQPSCPF
jgi:hypothetical protein